MKSLWFMTIWCMGLGAIGSWRSISAADSTDTVSVPVILRGSESASSGMTVPVGVARPLTPTTPSGKLPQYQLERDLGGSTDSTTQTNSAPIPEVLRCQLQLPERSILVEIVVMVDGQPYQQVRQARIARALRELTEGRSDTQQNQDEPAVPVSAEAAVASAPNTVPPAVESLTQRLRRYAAATGRTLTENEIDWLLTHTIDGPVCLWLNDHFQQVRGEQRPEFLVLDRNRDGVIAADELARAAETFMNCDANRNDMIEWIEIAAAAQPSEIRPRQPALPAVVTFVADRSPRPDLRLLVQFDRSAPDQSRLLVTALSPDLKDSIAAAIPGPAGLHLKLFGTPVIIQAVQSADPEVDQLSVGAIRDGYPWLPELDSYDDGRITQRELRDLLPRLTRFDTNGDGQLTEAEAVAPLRICLAWGPIVHRELAQLRKVGTAPESWNVTAPEWFVRMDRNRDRDLTRGEFPGTDEQFTTMDRDQDTFISVDEATRFNADNTEPARREARDQPPPADRPAGTPE